MSRTPGINGLRGTPRLGGQQRERDGRPFVMCVRVRAERSAFRMDLLCGHSMVRQFPAAHGAFCDVCGLERALGEKLAAPPKKSLARRALEARGSFAP